MKYIYNIFLLLSVSCPAQGTNQPVKQTQSFGTLYTAAHAADVLMLPFDKAFLHKDQSNLVPFYEETATKTIKRGYIIVDEFHQEIQKKQREEQQKKQQVLDEQLLTAIKENASLQEIQTILESGANPNGQEKRTGFTPLYYIIKYRREKERVMPSQCLYFSAYQKFIQAPLYETESESINKARMLLAAGALLNKQDQKGATALHYAAHYIDAPMCAALAQHAKDVEWFFTTAKLLLLINKKNKNQKKTWLPKPILAEILKQINPINVSIAQKKNYPNFCNVLTIKAEGFAYDKALSQVSKKTVYDIVYERIVALKKNLRESLDNRTGYYSLFGRSDEDVKKERKLKNLEHIAVLLGFDFNKSCQKNKLLQNTQENPSKRSGKYYEPAIYFDK